MTDAHHFEPFPLPHYPYPGQSWSAVIPPKVFAIELIVDEIRIRLEAPTMDELFELERRHKQSRMEALAQRYADETRNT